MASRLLLSRLALVLCSAGIVSLQLEAAELPVPCAGGSCGAGIPGFVTSGTATATSTTNALTVNQTSNAATLNWQSFNISRDASVTFNQPDATATALNRIFQADPSRIFGALNANGRVYLINQNGILFGEGARVNVASLVASSLDITPAAVSRGLAGAAADREPAFRLFTNEAGEIQVSGAVEVAAGAELKTATGGQILLFAPEVANRGTIRTPDGQTILAAGDSVFLATSSDPNLRGLLVEVGTGGTVTNGSDSGAVPQDPSQRLGQIVAERGNVTLVGLAVNQHGRVSASTSVRANGSIRLLARDGAQVDTAGGFISLSARRGGELEVGAGSQTEVVLDANAEDRTVDVNVQPKSRVELDGRRVTLARNARIVAPSGEVSVTARANSAIAPTAFDRQSDGSRILVEEGATIDVSGAELELAMERNVLTVELRGSQLADSPNQRNGPLRGETVQVDIRASGTRSDGSVWQGTPIGNVSGDISTIARDVAERNLGGGTVTLQSQGDVVVAGGATIDVSGGAIRYRDGYVATSQLLGADGRAYDISGADPDRIYTGIAPASAFVVEHPRWGVTETFFGLTPGRFEAGYVEGKDAGSLTVFAPNMIFDGAVRATTQVGRYQRLPSAAVPTSSLYRPYDQLPLGGLLTLGRVTGLSGPTGNPNYLVQDAEFASGLMLPTLRNDTGGIFDPRQDAWPSGLSVVRIRPELLGSEGAQQVTVRANGELTLAEDVALDLPVLGALDAIAGRVNVAGSIRATGGRVSLEVRPTDTTAEGTGQMHLRSTARIDLRGAWVNESRLVSETAPTDPLVINGGSIVLAARDSGLFLDAGSVIDVSGGARMRRDGTLAPGKGGSISISAAAERLDERVPVRVDSDLRGYAFETGASLSLSVGEICIAAITTVCSAMQENGTLITPEFFSRGGFSSYSLTANRRGLTVAPEAQLVLRADNFVPAAGLLSAESTRSLDGLATIGRLDDSVRRPVNLSLRTRHQAFLPVSAADFADAGRLELGARSSIVADPGARIDLASNTRMLLDGIIDAPAGSISATLTADLPLAEYLAMQSISVGDNARLAATGVLRAVTNDRGIRTGQVLDGGSVRLTAQRGYISASPRSVIDVSGTSGTLDVRRTAGTGGGVTERREVASAGGSISLSAADAILLSGTLSGASGAPGRVAGGTLSVQLDPVQRYDSERPTIEFPNDPRRIEISQTGSPIVLAPGAALPAQFQGRAPLAVEDIERGGFDAVTLAARTLRDAQQQSTLAAGEIALLGDVDFSLGRSLQLEASVLVSDGGRAQLQAPYLRFGNPSSIVQDIPTSVASNNGTLHLSGALIELVGNSTLAGFDTALFEASDGLRVRGVQLTGARELRGSLHTSGSLDLRARQIYPTTLTQFEFIAGEDGDGAIDIGNLAGSGSPGSVLSAGGALTLRAPEITHSGTLRAPFGSIVLDAQTLILRPGSLTSTTDGGESILFGETQGGFDWVYRLEGQTLVYSTSGIAPPAQQVNLVGEFIDVQLGASIDVRGGGDLLAAEFVPGVTGNRDVLSAELRPNSFAILPSESLGFAPYDPLAYEGSGILPGQSVYLAGGGGLPEGTYAILPARYAVLPGAYHVTPVDGYQDINAGEQFVRLDGSVVIAGARTFAGTALRAPRTSGFAVRSAADMQRDALYTLTGANAFFTAQATAAGQAAARLPRDAGTLGIAAGESLGIAGALMGQPATEGRGAALDITSDLLRIVASPTPGGSGGVVEISADGLRNFGAESILLGGTRRQSADGLQVTTRSTQVEVDSTALLTAPELMFAASDTVRVESGAVVEASGTAAAADNAVLVQGDGAFLRVSTGPDVPVERSGSTGAAGDVLVEAGATLRARGGSLAIESSRTARLDATLDVAGGTLALAGDRISLGDTQSVSQGLALSNAQLAGLGVDNLILSSRSSIDFLGAALLSADDITLRASELRAIDNAQGSITVSDTLTLEGTNFSGATPGSGTSDLSVTTNRLLFTGDDLGIIGFANVSFAASTLELHDTGSLTVGGALNVQAGNLTAGSGANRAIRAAGSFAYTSVGAASLAAVDADPELGSRVSISAAAIDFNGRATLRSGQLDLLALGAGQDVSIGDAAVIDLSGVTTTFDGQAVASRGGTLSLESRFGSVRAADAARIGLSSPGDALVDGGSLALHAASGEIDFRAALTGAGANFGADGASIVDFAGLNRRLNSGGFTGERHVRQRGVGDVVVDADPQAAVNGRRVSIVADQGSIVIAGTVRSEAARGGRIELAARDDVIVNGVLDAGAASDDARAGSIDVSTAQGRILFGSSARVATAGAAGADRSGNEGRLLLRAPRTGVLSVLDGSATNDALALGGDFRDVDSLIVEGVAAYVDADGLLDAADTLADAANPYFADAAAFIGATGGFANAFPGLRGPAPVVAAGIEIRSTGNLELQSDWDLSAWRFGDLPGFLTLRAQGDLLFNASLSDGFTGTVDPDAFLLTSTAPSWSYRLAAGADLAGASALAVRDLSALSADQGNLRVAPGLLGTATVPSTLRMIRTGTGSIDIAAARNLELGNRASVIYTAGVASDGVLFVNRGQLGGRMYPTNGGDISIFAGQDVVGAPTNQLVTDWLWRTGSVEGIVPTAPAWTVNFARFEQNVGALGGGDLRIRAGRNVNDLSAVIPSIGRQVGGTSLAASQLQVIGGGAIDLRVSNDIAGGSFYAGRGTVDVVAGDSIGAGPQSGIFTALALGDATASLSARSGLTLSAIVNPTLLPHGRSQQAGTQSSFFATYTAQTRAGLSTLAGDARLVNETSAIAGSLRASLTSMNFLDVTREELGLRVAPPTVEVAALRGDVTLSNSLGLFPATNGGLDIFAYGDANLRGPTGFDLIVSDADPGYLPSIAAPRRNFSRISEVFSAVFSSNQTNFNAPIPVRLTGAAPDMTPSRIVALTGDLTTNGTFYFGESARLSAGRDVKELGLIVQNLRPSDVSVISAGRDIRYSLPRNETGRIIRTPSEIIVDGPGYLLLRAGRDLDLQTSSGVTSRGNLKNLALPDAGAAISVQVGTGARAPDNAAFIDRYLRQGDDYDELLVAYMAQRSGGQTQAPQQASSQSFTAQRSGVQTLAPEEALEAFSALAPVEQAPLLEQILFAELRASGRSAAQPGAGNNDFTAGFDALTTYFPGSNPDPDDNELNPYSGSMRLFFSRIYTLDGGDVSLISPGGEINAGLATPPTSFGISKGASDLGVVAQSSGSVRALAYQDFLVNESRVFAADGGDILVWSTRGDIDAGRGAKTAISAPPPVITFDPEGRPLITFPPALTGSGIQTLASTPERKPGNVDLFAPRGVVNAGDAGIVAGNLTIAATAVLGADNIKVSGVAVGVPVDTGGLGSALSGVSAVASSASSAATDAVDTGRAAKEDQAPLSQSALGWLEVFVLGFGEEVCKDDDIECLKRNKKN